VDLRDGNQALAIPMNVGQKLELFQSREVRFRNRVGFRRPQIPSSLNRRLIEERRVPDDVAPVLVQARDLIDFCSSRWSGQRAIIHPTTPPPRSAVFGMSKGNPLRGGAVAGAERRPGGTGSGSVFAQATAP
jgi:2-isopropylmalate synthase